MSIRLAIEASSSERNPRWEESCRALNIEYEIVDCYATGIISVLRSFGGLIWPFSNHSHTDLLMARHVIASAERMGVAVFPNIDTCWHFDDKIAQKYALEAVKAPLVPSYVFYTLPDALAWLKAAQYPLVRKLRRGAWSTNVGLVRDFGEARQYCERMFGEGISPAPAPFADSRRRITQMLTDPGVLWRRTTGLVSHLRQSRAQRRQLPIERGYVYFQEFIPDNTHDVRITVVGDRAWGFTREVRPGDFRASGSGRIGYDRERIPLECVRIAFEMSAALHSQSTAFDFVMNAAGKPMILEMSYGYQAAAVYNAPGHWSPDGQWHEGHTWPQTAIVSDLVDSLKRRNREVGHTDSARDGSSVARCNTQAAT
jgi:hypothetical protein